MIPADATARGALDRYLQGAISAEMALMYWIRSVPDLALIARDLEAITRATAGNGYALRAEAACKLRSLLEEHRAGCARMVAMMRSGLDNDEPAPDVDAGIAFCRQLFDWSVLQSPESSVAFYSLGDAHLLDAATAEIVRWLWASGCVGPESDVLDLGCGIGRFEQALSPDVRSITGIDVSANMIAEASRRCREFANVRLRKVSGRDLAFAADASFDLVLAMDSFPYIVQSGMPLVERHFAEFARVLRPRGTLLILEFSYRNDPGRDDIDMTRLATDHGFTLTRQPSHPFSSWDGRVYSLQRSGSARVQDACTGDRARPASADTRNCSR